MKRFETTFARAREENRAALVIYLCAGDAPGGLQGTVDLAVEAADAGADILELGVPFSDPTADGPAIQRASRRALDAGVTLPAVLEAAAAIRARRPELPILLFGYYNPLFRFGLDEVASEAKKSGIDGFLVVDLPPAEVGPLHAALTREELGYVPLLAPTSTPDRIEAARKVARGFVYYVSMTGVTGSKAAALPEAAARAHELAERMMTPVVVGFGVATPDDASAVAQKADGVVVGSAVVRAIQSADDLDGAKRAVRTLVSGLAGGCAR